MTPETFASLKRQWRERRAHTYASENAEFYRGFDNGCGRCAEELESGLERRVRELRNWLRDSAQARKAPAGEIADKLTALLGETK